MAQSFSGAYRDAGVDIEAGYEGVRRIKKHIDKTSVSGVISGIGGFGGLYKPDLSGLKEPVLVSGTDGVGTKIRIAQLLDKHDTVGIDCVAMCVNDVICCGAKPLFFLDYIAIGRNDPAKVENLVSGVSAGCIEAGIALIGGETAEHPGVMSPDDYDLAGFTVGIVDKEKIIDTGEVREGDVIIALASSGLHSNGFSLVRKVFDAENTDLGKFIPELNKSLGEELLTPTRIYVKPVLNVMEKIRIHGMAHITGGGFYENVPRALPCGLTALIRSSAIPVPPIFTLIRDRGEISERDMFNTFNMGVGMCLIVSEYDSDETLKILGSSDENAFVIGEIVRGTEKIEVLL